MWLMALEDAVPLYLTILMAALAIIALVGGSSTDKKKAGADPSEKTEQ